MKITGTHKFIEYNNITDDERELFQICGLNHVILRTGMILKKHICPMKPQHFDKFYFSEESESVLNRLISELLVMIGAHSNQIFGTDPIQQHNFFKTPKGWSSFPGHVIHACFYEADAQWRKKNKNSAMRFSKKAEKEIAACGKWRFGCSKLRKNEVNAVASLYKINFILWNIRELVDSKKLSRLDTYSFVTWILRPALDSFMILDDSEQKNSHVEGGKQGDKKKRYTKAKRIIEKMVRYDPDLDTSILAKRAQTKISGLKYQLSPRGIKDEIRSVKNKLRRK